MVDDGAPVQVKVPFIQEMEPVNVENETLTISDIRSVLYMLVDLSGLRVLRGKEDGRLYVERK